MWLKQSICCPTFFINEDPTLPRRYPEIDPAIDEETGAITPLSAWSVYRRWRFGDSKAASANAIEICWPTWMSEEVSIACRSPAIIPRSYPHRCAYCVLTLLFCFIFTLSSVNLVHHQSPINRPLIAPTRLSERRRFSTVASTSRRPKKPASSLDIVRIGYSGLNRP